MSSTRHKSRRTLCQGRTVRACVHSVGMLCGYMPNSSLDYIFLTVNVVLEFWQQDHHSIDVIPATVCVLSSMLLQLFSNCNWFGDKRAFDLWKHLAAEFSTSGVGTRASGGSMNRAPELLGPRVVGHRKIVGKKIIDLLRKKLPKNYKVRKRCDFWHSLYRIARNLFNTRDWRFLLTYWV